MASYRKMVAEYQLNKVSLTFEQTNLVVLISVITDSPYRENGKVLFSLCSFCHISIAPAHRYDASVGGRQTVHFSD